MGCLLIGKDIVNIINTCPLHYGALDGFVNNDVAGAYSADVGNDGPAISGSLMTIVKNRCYKSIRNEVFYWIKVNEQLIHKINKKLVIEISEIIEEIPQELKEILIRANTGYLLFLTEGKSNATALRIITSTGFRADLHLLDNQPDPFKRINGLIPLHELKDKKAAVIGLGSGGSFVTMELAAGGIGELHLLDKDKLYVENLFRHVCDRRDLGRNKAEAVRDKIKDHLLPVKIETYTSDILYSVDDLRNIITKVDIVLCATDTPQSRAMVNYICLMLNKPLILVCTFDNATIGEIIRVNPWKSACYECIRMHLNRALIEDKDNRDEVIPYSTQAIETDENSLGTRTDVVLVASIAAKVALMTLTEGLNTGFGKLYSNYLTWGSTRNIKFVEPFNFKNPFSTNFMDIGIHPKCPICGDIPEEIKNICVEDKYNEIIKALET